MSNTCCSASKLFEANEHHCPVEATLGLIGGKYKALILWKLIPAPMRFSELRRAVPGATPKMLTQQLRELAACKLDIQYRADNLDHGTDASFSHIVAPYYSLMLRAGNNLGDFLSNCALTGSIVFKL